MAKVFISYRRTDSSTFSGRIYDRLVGEFGRKNIFKDVDDIPPGENFTQYIQHTLRRCAAQLVVIGPRWLDALDGQGNRRLGDPTDFVRLEIETALNLGLVVIPLLVDDATMPAAAELPESLRPLAQLNALQVRNDPDFTRDMERVNAALERIVARRSTPGLFARRGASLPPVHTTSKPTSEQAVPDAPFAPAAENASPTTPDVVAPAVADSTDSAAPQPTAHTNITQPPQGLPGGQVPPSRMRRIRAPLLAGLATIVVVTSFVLLFSAGPGRSLFPDTPATKTASADRLATQQALDATATVTVTPLPTATATPTGPFSGTPSYQDSLRDNSVGNWLIYSDQYHSCGFRGSQYHATVAPVYGIECVNSKMSWQNFALEVTMTIIADGQTAGGISFRRASTDRSDFRGYNLMVFQSGRMVLAECPSASSCGTGLGNKQATTFKVGVGKTNIIGIVAKGPHLSIYANGQLVMTATDSHYAGGYMSLNATYANASGDVAYSDLKVWQA